MRLSLLMGQPPSVVKSWPASDIHLLGQYLSREPAPAERAEYGSAYLAYMYANAHRRPHDAPKKLEQFLLWRDAWKPRGRYADNEMDILDVLDNL